MTTRMLYVTPVQSWAFCLITSHILSSSLIEKVHQDVAYASMPLTLKSFDSMPYVLAMSHSVVTRLCAESIFKERPARQAHRWGGLAHRLARIDSSCGSDLRQVACEWSVFVCCLAV